MIGDTISAMQRAVCDHLNLHAKQKDAEIDGVIAPEIPWRPHVFHKEEATAWQVHPVLPDSASWERRIERALGKKTTVRVGVATTSAAIQHPTFLLACHRLDATILLLKERRDLYVVERSFASVTDYICECRVKLDEETAPLMLDISLARAQSAKTNAQKGITLELLVALVLSQVENFEVKSKGIANRTQQIDVVVHNRSVAGVLSGSPIVIAEAKNWTNPVTPTEHAHLRRKLETRNGKAKLGFLVTTGRFTAGVAAEARRDSKEDTVVVLIDGGALPQIWQNSESITEQIEQLVISASFGE